MTYQLWTLDAKGASVMRTLTADALASTLPRLRKYHRLVLDHRTVGEVFWHDGHDNCSRGNKPHWCYWYETPRKDAPQ